MKPEKACASKESTRTPTQRMFAQSVGDAELKRLLQDEAMKLPDMNIAVSGMAGRFPKANSVNELEECLLNGTDMINENDEERFTCGLWGLPKRAGRLIDLTKFDNEFFDINIEEANHMDFQMRILYEVVYEALLDAGLNPAEMRGTKTGVFLGLHCNEFENEIAADPAVKPLGYFAQHAIRIAQYFDFRGLTSSYDAACASGFVGMYAAVQALSEGLIDQAIVCSSTIPIKPIVNFAFLQLQMLSPSGYSRFLDDKGDGYVKSEACVALVLQRKHLARRNYSSVMAALTSVDGYKPEGITFPSVEGQETLIRKTNEFAGITTNHIEYIEAHGTGTPAGDPQEAQAIANVYFSPMKQTVPVEGSDEATINYERKIGPLLIGSSKTNMGHSEGASGLCALVKVALMLENEIIYKCLHYNKANPLIKPLIEGKLKVVEETQELRSKIVPLSCYGFGGCNVHAILRANERPAIKYPLKLEDNLSEPCLVVMFGRSEASINQFFDLILDENARHTRYCLSDDFLALVNTLSSGKIDRLMNWRGYMVVNRCAESDKRELIRDIKQCDLQLNQQRFVQDSNNNDVYKPLHVQDTKKRACSLILPGLGSQWPAMAAGLIEYKPFSSTITRLTKYLLPYGIDLVQLLTEQSGQLQNNSLTNLFVSIVAYEIALINLVRDQVKLNDLTGAVGHSIGEVACAYAVGLFDERETILVAYKLGKVLTDNKNLVSGRMAAVSMSEEETEDMIANYKTIQVSCINGPYSVTISGSFEEMDQISQSMERNNIHFQNIESCSIALHNEFIMTQEIKHLLQASLRQVLVHNLKYNRGNHQDWVSSIRLPSDSLILKQANAEYFAECLCKKVDFFSALKKLNNDSIVLELGPSGIFQSQIEQILPTNNLNEDKGKEKVVNHNYVKLMHKSIESGEQTLDLLKGLGELYLAGATFKNLAEYNNINNNQTSTKQQSEKVFPVRRQTPSISSLFKWNHDKDFFVPRYPAQFSKSAAKAEVSIDILEERDKYISDHQFEGRVLFPATGYLLVVWRVFSLTKNKIYDAAFHQIEKSLVPVEFHNVRLLRAVVLCRGQAEIRLHFDESTGHFEITEGGSLVADGFAKSPVENPTGLLYGDTIELIKKEKLDVEALNSDDVYKLFRVSGYDYGNYFRNIISASADGRESRIKYNSHFASFTDSVLQTIFLAVTKYAPSGGLFLPTRFDYVRFQPEMIFKKLKETGTRFDLYDDSLSTKVMREIMTKMRDREREAAGIEPENETGDKEGERLNEEQAETCQSENLDQPQEEKKEEEEASAEKKEEEKLPCIFDTYCDPITGIIITDGVEMRGIRAMLAPRRVDNSEVLLESYQFVKDIEDPIEDDNLTKLDEMGERYVQIVNSMSISLLCKLLGKNYNQLNGLTYDTDNHLTEIDENVQQFEEEYLKKYLTCIYSTGELKEEYEIKKNGDYTLMSVLDQLLKVKDREMMRNILTTNRVHLKRDYIQQTFTSERVARSLLETVVENVCLKKLSLRLMEINVDDGLLFNSITSSLKRIEPSLSIDYLLAHPDIERLKTNKMLIEGGENQPKTHKLKDLDSLFSDRQLRNLSLIIYKDISCYSVNKCSSIDNKPSHIVRSLSKALAAGGFVLVVVRQELTFAEKIVISLEEQNLLEEKEKKVLKKRQHCVLDGLNSTNEILKSRCQLLIDEAEKASLLFAGKKSALNGCTLLLFRKRIESNVESKVEALDVAANEERVLVRVMHDNKKSISGWLETLKENFAKSDDETSSATEGQQQQQQQQELEASGLKEHKSQRVVWLCAVETRQKQISGVVGLMQALRKELGSLRLRCFYDLNSFKYFDEPIDESQIEQSDHFKHALERDFLWNVVDSYGNFGSFRHFTINDYFNYDNCLCSKQSITDQQQVTVDPTNQSTSPTKYAYVNNAIRGDLSSFTWFEAPLNLVDNGDQKDLVKISYAALNFRDIMLASGKLPLDAIPVHLAMSDCLLGLEFSGYDSNGKRVMGMVSGRGIATHVLCPERGSMKLAVPDWMSLKEAATIPIVYATAVMALIYRGKMQSGESVLIHAGSGGVGQAAIRLAAYHGLTVYTTVGSEEKRKFLLEEFADCLDDDRIFSSRDCIFEERIMKATQGRGVDLILNSLADDKLHASVRCLADGGRFLEIGKYDLAFDTKLELLKLDTNKTFHGILLDKLFDFDIRPSFKESMRKTFEVLRQGLEKGYVRPIKYTVFKRNQVEDAFRYMATGKHMGKILIEIEDESAEARKIISPKCIPKFQPSNQKSYIITGGLGGFGLELTKWLVNQGAQNILLTSRNGCKTGYQKTSIARLRSINDAQILVVDSGIADTTTLEGAKKLVSLALDMSPIHVIGGIFHLAMVLKDTLIQNMSADDFEVVFNPKVETFLHLDKVTRDLNLNVDYFVGFSSVTSGKGNAGQANYAYANSCLERICEKRRNYGHHALAIQWGAIGDVGVAYEMLGANDVIVGGTIPQRIPSCLNTLSKLLCSPFTVCFSVVPVNKNLDTSGIRGDLVAAVLNVLGIKDQSKVRDETTLGELGLDSLMAVEIRQYIERDYDISLSHQEIRSLTIAKIREINSKERPTKASIKSESSREKKDV